MARGRKPKSQGLGDTVEKVLESTGIKSIVKFIAGEDCGCDERKDRLNILFAYQKPLCLIESEYEVLKSIFENKKTTFRPTEIKVITTIFNRVFQQRQEPTSCSSCFKDMLNKLKKVYESYI